MRPTGTMLLALLMLPALARAEKMARFTPSPFFNEQTHQWKTHQARVAINAPGDFDAKKPTQLIIYLLPNGNTIEQTMGAKLSPGMDWHFDIQHIAAQTRKLRSIDHDHNIVVACAESDEKSWPGYRRVRVGNGQIIREIVAEIEQSVGGQPKVTLMGHSGGGSFIFGYINGGDAIGDEIERISFIDSTYGYTDDEKHGDKLLAWLKADPTRHLTVFAYNDRNVKFNGKNIVSPTGGTYYRSHKMVDRINQDSKLIESQRGPFEEFVGMNGQVHFLIHTNPEIKILHTVLVERNGLLEAMTFGTPLEKKWGGEFWGERAYTEFVQPSPAGAASAPASAPAKAAGIPDRAANALGGKAFAETIADLPPAAREAAIVQEITKGNVPKFLRTFREVHSGNCVYEVAPDYLAIGSDEDFVRMPMTPISAKAIAMASGMSLPTRKMVNDIYSQATVKLEPKPLTEQREAVRSFVQHNDLIEIQRKGKPLGELVAGDKKDIVLSNRLREKPHKVAIYGWHKLDGKAIQPLYVGHGDFYSDYSHGVRLVKRDVKIDGQTRSIDEVLRDPKLSELLSDEGVIDTTGLYE